MDLQMITFVCFISWIDRTTDSWSMRRESVFDLILYVSFLKKERKVRSVISFYVFSFNVKLWHWYLTRNVSFLTSRKLLPIGAQRKDRSA